MLERLLIAQRPSREGKRHVEGRADCKEQRHIALRAVDFNMVMIVFVRSEQKQRNNDRRFRMRLREAGQEGRTWTFLTGLKPKCRWRNGGFESW